MPRGATFHWSMRRGTARCWLFDRENAARIQLVNPLVDRQGCRNIGTSRQHAQRSPVNMIIEAPVSANRLELGRKDEVAADPAVIKRLFAEPITNELKRAGIPVPHGKSKHADRLLDRLLQAPGGDRLNERFRVAITAPADPALSVELLAKCQMIVDLTVERQHETSVSRQHWLMPHRREIDDG